MKKQFKDTRIPLKKHSMVRDNTGQCYVIDDLFLKAKYSLVYLAHMEDNPQHTLAILELYPRPDVRMEAFVQRQDNGAILIYNPFSALLGRDDMQLQQTFKEALVKEIPMEFADLEPEWIMDGKNCHYLIMDPEHRKPIPIEEDIPEINPLPLIPKEDLVSYLILHKYPLYRYREENGDIPILCLGSGDFMQRMILSVLSCGQIPNARLRIQVVSDIDREKFANNLLRQAPLLSSYLDLSQEEPQTADGSISFHYLQVSDILSEDILAELPYSRYILISLGDSDCNCEVADILTRQYKEKGSTAGKNTIIHYHTERADTLQSFPALPQWLKVIPFSETLNGYSKSLQELGHLTVRLAHMYNKLGNARISLSETETSLIENAYNQKSSCASALHLKYKLAGLGIDPDGNAEEIIASYRQLLANKHCYANLLANEHTRWMYYMISEQYTLPTEADLLRYGFEEDEDGSFNSAWKSKKHLFHPCLVPCRNDGIVLTDEDWKCCNSREAIEASGFDPLDKVSLMLHLYAEEKCKKILDRKIIPEIFQLIWEKLSATVSAASVPENGEIPQVLQNLQQVWQETQTVVCSNAEALLSANSNSRLDKLLCAFSALEIDIIREISDLKKYLSVFVEFAAFRNYKEPDEAIIRQLPWILYGDTELILIMFCNQTVADSIATPLLTDPDRIVYLGSENHPEWGKFLKEHGCRGEVSFVCCSQENTQTLLDALQAEVDRLNRKCVIDITGAKDIAVIAAHQICTKDNRVSLIRRAGSTLENICNYPYAPIYTLPVSMTAEDVFTLHGAQRKPAESYYMEQIENLAPVLWDFYRQYKDQWNMISAFFGLPKATPAELYLNGLSTGPDVEWEQYTFTVDHRKWEITNLEKSLRLLAKEGLIKSLGIKQKKQGKPYEVKFRFPKPKGKDTATKINEKDIVTKLLERFFKEYVPHAQSTYQCFIGKDFSGSRSITISSGYHVSLSDNNALSFCDGNGKNYSYYEMEPILRDMQKLGLITIQEISGLYEKPCRISFRYVNPALWECLKKAGNILELYIWEEARKTYFFDDVQANFSFIWKENVSNELDVVLTHGASSLIISAKTGAMNKEHLYEIGLLTSRFSVNSIPVIVYSSDKAYEDRRITDDTHPVKQRASAMGIHLIDLNEKKDSLGEKLISIIKGKNMPIV